MASDAQPPEEPVIVTTRLTARDAYGYHVWDMYLRNPVVLLISAFSVFCLLAFCASYVIPIREFAELSFSQRARLLFLPTISIVSLVFTWFISRRNFQKMRELHAEIRYEIGPQGIAITSGERTTRHRWSMYSKTVETPWHFFVFFPDRVAHLIPKRCFGGPEEIAHARQWFKAEVARRAKK